MGLFASKTKKLLQEGVLAQAVLTDVRDTGVTINNNPQVRLVFRVEPDGGEPFEASVRKTVSRVQIPQPGMTVFVRYDPANRSKIVVDEQAVAEYNARGSVRSVEAQALAVPADLAEHGIPGRAMVKAVESHGAVGPLVNARVTAAVRLIDGSPMFETTFAALLAPDTVTSLQSTRPIVPFAIRVDPADRTHAALAPAEEVPVVPYDNPPVVEAAATALSKGTAGHVTVLEFQRQYLRVAGGEEIYSLRVRLDDGTEALAGAVLVPPAGQWLIKDGARLPARIVADEPELLAVDWDSALREAGAGAAR